MVPTTWPPTDPEIADALQAAWRDGSWGRYDGPNSERLIAAIRELNRTQHVSLCSSGTIAVELALRGVGVNAGDEVVLAGYDFPGNFRAIEAIGAKPVLADIDPATWCMDERSLGDVVGPQTRAILVSHLHGGLARMPAIREVADRFSLAIVEDACQAPGAIVAGRPAGMWGDVGVWSFGGSKLLTAGRGGAIFTNRDDVIPRAKVFFDRGNHAFPLSELQAAVLLPQVLRLPARNADRWKNVCRLRKRMESLAALQSVAVPPFDAEMETGNQPAFYKLAFRLDAAASAVKCRDQWIATLQQRQIPLDAGFRGFATRSANRCRKPIPLPNSQQAAEATLILHHPVLLEAEHAIDQLADAIMSVFAE